MADGAPQRPRAIFRGARWRAPGGRGPTLSPKEGHRGAQLIAQAPCATSSGPGWLMPKPQVGVEELEDVDEVLERIVVLPEPLGLVDITVLEQRWTKYRASQPQPERKGGSSGRSNGAREL